jgi:hypothetical protein
LIKDIYSHKTFSTLIKVILPISAESACASSLI